MRKIVKDNPALRLITSEKVDGRFHGFSVTLDFVFPEYAVTIEELNASLLAALKSPSMPSGQATIRTCKPNPLSGLPT